MPFEPVSVVGMVGTTLGILGFMVSTVENITTRHRHYMDCRKKLKEYHHTLGTTSLELEAWTLLWSRHKASNYISYGDDAYVYLWGEQGFQDIVARSGLIRLEMEEITELLKCRNTQNQRIDWATVSENGTSPSEHELQDWCNVLLGSAEQLRKSNAVNANWLYKFLFAIYRNSHLEARIKNLQERANELRKTSILWYRKRGHDGEADVSHIKQSVDLQEERRQLIRFLDILHQDNTAASLHWHLVLGSPSLQPALSRLRRMSRVQLEFIFREHIGSSVHEIKLPYPKVHGLPRLQLLESICRDQAHLPKDSRTHLLGQVSSLAPYEQLQLRMLSPVNIKDTSVYALAAVTAARSAILLHQSSWIDGLCFCGITIYCPNGSAETTTFHQRADCIHVDGRLRKEVFLLLAVLLAELAIGAPIQIYLPGLEMRETEPEFEVPEAILLPGYKTHMNWETLSELLSERMYEVPEQVVSVEYLEAMEHCFCLSRTLCERDFLNNDLDECIAKIETPLMKGHELLVQRSRELEHRSWYRTLALQQNRPVVDEPMAELES